MNVVLAGPEALAETVDAGASSAFCSFARGTLVATANTAERRDGWVFSGGLRERDSRLAANRRELAATAGCPAECRGRRLQAPVAGSGRAKRWPLSSSLSDHSRSATASSLAKAVIGAGRQSM